MGIIYTFPFSIIGGKEGKNAIFKGTQYLYLYIQKLTIIVVFFY